MVTITNGFLEDKLLKEKINNFWKDILIMSKNKYPQAQLKEEKSNTSLLMLKMPDGKLCPIEKTLANIYQKGFLGLGKKIEYQAYFSIYNIDSRTTNKILIFLNDKQLQKDVTKIAMKHEKTFSEGIFIYPLG